MIEDQFLNLFITEDIYKLAESETMQVPEPPIAQEPKPKDTQNIALPPQEPTQKTNLHELAIWTPPLTSKDRQLLTKILQAVNKDINKAHIMEGIGKYEPDFEKLLCFGYQKELELKVGKAVELYKPTDADGKLILTSAAPADLHDSREEKAKLWSALQQVFLK